jgi:hypothetical protein
MAFYQVTLFSPLQCTIETVRGCVSLNNLKSQGSAVEMTVNSKEDNSSDFCLDFVRECGLWII